MPQPYTVTGRIVGTPTYYSTSRNGNPSRQFIVLSGPGISRPGTPDLVRDYRTPLGAVHHDMLDVSQLRTDVLVTASDAQLGYAIGNAEYRDRVHVFTVNGHGRVTGATPVDEL